MEAKCKILLGGFAGGLLGVTVAFGVAILMGALWFTHLFLRVEVPILGPEWLSWPC